MCVSEWTDMNFTHINLFFTFVFGEVSFSLQMGKSSKFCVCARVFLYVNNICEFTEGVGGLKKMDDSK